MRPFDIIAVDQRSADWYSIRAGRVTSSKANAMLAEGKKKGEESTQRRDLRIELAVEQLTGKPKDDGTGYSSRYMDEGEELEPEAIGYYEAVTGRAVRRTGFLKHTDLMVGASLDGDVQDCTGIVEVKCPKQHTHITYLLTQTIPLNYQRQILHQMFVSGAQWADFISYCPSLPEKGRLVMLRVRRENLDMKAYELALRLFLREVEQERERLRELLGMAV